MERAARERRLRPLASLSCLEVRRGLAQLVKELVLGGSHAQRRFGVAHQPADALQRGHGGSRAEVLLGLG